MRLNKLILKNYIGIYNGMGLHKIEIDFSKCINNIIVIKGDNGSGKSSIFKSIHPFPDTNYYLINGLSASKEISYELNDGSILDIIYNYPIDNRGERKSTTCDIFLNGIPQNPSRNVTTGKDRICNILDIDMNFLTLAQLSSEDRGLADKTPSDRKKFINKRIAELDSFNDIYKRISKKSSELKSLVTSFDTKINSIGNIESIKSNIKLWDSQLNNLEEQKIEYVSKLSELQTKMKSLYTDEKENPSEVYGKLNNELNTLFAKLKELEIHEDIDKLESKIKENEICIQVNNNKLETLNENRSSTIEKKYKLDAEIQDLRVKIDSIGNINLINQYENKINYLISKKEEFESMCIRNGFLTYNNILPEEYDFILFNASKIKALTDKIKSSCKYIYDALDYVINNIPFNSEYTDDGLRLLEESKKELDKLIEEQNFYKKHAVGVELIPKECMLKDTCYFVKAMVEANNNIIPDDEYNNIMNQLSITEKDIKKYKEEMNRENEIKNSINQLTNLLNICEYAKSSILKVSQVKPKDINDNKTMLLCCLQGQSWFDIDFSYFNSIKNSFIEYKGYEKDIESIQKQYNSLMANKQVIEYMNNQLDKLNSEYREYENKFNSISDEIDEVNNLNLELNIKQSELTDKLRTQIEYNDNMTKFNELNTKIKQYENNYNEYVKLSDEFESIKEKLNSIMNEQIPYLNKNINDSKYKLVLYNDYVRDYDKYSKEFEKIETIKYYCSPTTGIQTIYMEMYMNNIIGISNQLLSMFFGGNFVLQPFIINEKEFRMPVLGSGILNDDISSMSTSQISMISMIISFALLSRTSNIYNIIKMDELEGGLDTINRLAFFDVLTKLMNYLHFSQCIMISHNTELNSNNMDIIILKNSDPSMSIEGNIIFNLEEYVHNANNN